ncbi:MAG: 3-oxoacyl-ACP synthase [bacterium]|nr:3-oxoacyl-ACP synthase [bacterium]
MKKNNNPIEEIRTRRTSPSTDWERLRAMTDEEAEAAASTDPESNPPVSEADWRNAKLVSRTKENKVAISIRVDSDVLEWFKEEGGGYLTRMNNVLRTYMEAHRQS